MPSIEEFQRAGLYDRAADAEPGRPELLDWLAELGFSIAEMIEALEEQRLVALAADRRIVPGRRLSNREAMDLTGLSAETLEATATAFGFTSRGGVGPSPGGLDLALTEVEAEALVTSGVIAAIFSEEEARGFHRVVGSALARIADAVVSAFLADVEGPHLAEPGNELELARKTLDAAALLDDFVPLLDPVLRRHISQAIERSRLTVISNQERLRYRYAIGFIDLVGYTPMSQEMSARQLGMFIRDFEGRAHDVITGAGGRLVKLIGDEVMFVAPNPDSACLVAEGLMSGFTAAGGRDAVPRGGMSYGEVLVRGGDYYGDMVNLASRLADQAGARELLVTERFADEATCLQFADGGARTLKGFNDRVVVRSLSFPPS